jgi:8-oxo-dGTP pyrophosphatase MutT (NUDIX family)
LIEQAAAVPYRPAGDGYEILLITTKKGKWAIPKGIIDPGETPQETAAKEAYEEAGVHGEVEDGVIGTFEYRKWGEELHVQVFLLRVEETENDFEDADVRKRAWLSPQEARQFIRKRNRGVLTAAIAILDERFGRA